ncbi:MAG: ATP-binding protein, partial [Bacteroidota bacterium]
MPRHLPFIWIFLFICCLSTIACADTVLQLTGEKQLFEIGGHVFIFPTNEDLTIDDFRQVSADSLIPVSDFAADEDPAYVWGYFEIESDGAEEHDWWINFRNNDYCDIYIKDLTYKTGYLVPGSEKPIIAGSYYVPLTLPKGERAKVYFKLRKDFHPYNFAFYVDTAISRVDHLWYKKLWAMFLQGILLIMAVYGLMVYYSTREKIYLFYSLYLISTAIFYQFVDAFLREYIIPEYPGLAYIGVLMLYPSAICYFHFLKEFIDFSLVHSWVLKMINTMLRVSYVFTLVVLVVYVSNNEQYLEIFTQVYVLLNACVALIALGYLGYTKNTLGLYFIMGSSFLLMAVILDVILWDSDLIWGSFTRLGLVVEVCFFSLGLGERFRASARERNALQEQLIDELEHSKQFIEASRLKLEEKVKSRTSELAEQNQKLQIAKEEADNALKAKSDFLSIMSHEIRTPMNGVIGMTHLLLDEITDPQQQESLQSLKFSAENLLSLLNDILDYNKIDSGNVEMDLSTFNIKELVSSLQYQFKLKAEEKGVQFLVELGSDVPEWLVGDQGKITQVLMNLVSNSIKFTNEGSVCLKLVCKQLNQQKARIYFEVSDTGIGIPQEKQKMIFEQFTQASSDTSRKYGGTGLGLSIIKKLLLLLGSEIQLESKRGVGSKFYFTIDFLIGKYDKAPQIERNHNAEETLKSLRVLSVDDNQMNRMVLDRFLSKWQVKVHDLAASGDEAISLLLRNDYDLILLDLQMPDVNGYQVSQMIRTMDEDKYQKIPIIALSADIFADVYNDVKEYGMNDFVSKPF